MHARNAAAAPEILVWFSQSLPLYIRPVGSHPCRFAEAPPALGDWLTAETIEPDVPVAVNVVEVEDMLTPDDPQDGP
jgi:hypothetical protein